MGRSYYSSYVGYGLLRYREYWWRLKAKFSNDKPALLIPPTPEEERIGEERFVAFVEHMEEHFAANGTRLAFVYLPSMTEPLDCHDNYDEILPPRFPRIDLQRELRPQMERHEFIALGHYGPELSERVGGEMYTFAESILEHAE